METLDSRFGYLIKHRTKAMSMFDKLVARLDFVSKEMHKEIERSTKLIDDHKTRVSNEEQAIEFARREIAAAQNTISKIQGLIS